jgi:hypothetical protein
MCPIMANAVLTRVRIGPSWAGNSASMVCSTVTSGSASALRGLATGPDPVSGPGSGRPHRPYEGWQRDQVVVAGLDLHGPHRPFEGYQGYGRRERRLVLAFVIQAALALFAGTAVARAIWYVSLSATQAMAVRHRGTCMSWRRWPPSSLRLPSPA